MMAKGLKSKIAMMGIGVLAMTGLVTTGSAVAADPASAYTDSKCYKQYDRKPFSYELVYPLQWRYSCWRDYNWWEESWMGGSHRDGWT